MPLLHDLDQRGRVSVLRLAGELTLLDDRALRALFLRQVRAGRVRVVCDMRGVRFADSRAIGSLVWAFKRLQAAGGDLRLFGLTGLTARIFDIMGLDRVFRLFETEPEAVRSYLEDSRTGAQSRAV